MRLLVCGSRTWNENDMIMDQILYGIMESYGAEHMTIIEGEAPGADRAAGVFAETFDLNLEKYPADWNKHGKRAGYVRNAQMLLEGKPDLVIAFVDKDLAESKGTAMMVKIAREAGVPVYVVQRMPSLP